MNRNRIVCGAWWGVLWVVLTGCLRMGPDYRRPEVPPIRPPAYQHAPDSPARAETGKRWWAAFNDPALNRVVEETLAHNWDLQKASARILEVRSQLHITAASRYPSLDLTAGIQRQRRTVNQARVVSGKITREDVTQTTDAYTLSFPAAFEIDLWGRLAQAEAAARGDLLQALENRRTVAQTVVSEAASLYLQMEALERRIQITEKTVKSYKQSLTLVENRYNRGLTSILDVRQARRTLARAELLLPPLRQELGGGAAAAGGSGRKIPGNPAAPAPARRLFSAHGADTAGNSIGSSGETAGCWGRRSTAQGPQRPGGSGHGRPLSQDSPHGEPRIRQRGAGPALQSLQSTLEPGRGTGSTAF